MEGLEGLKVSLEVYWNDWKAWKDWNTWNYYILGKSGISLE